MRTILRRIKRNNTLSLKALKYFFHIYSLFALIGFVMCPAIQNLGGGSIDNIVIKGRTGAQSVLHKTDKKTTSLKFVFYSGSELESSVRENQNISTYSSIAFNPAITSLATTRLIL